MRSDASNDRRDGRDVREASIHAACRVSTCRALPACDARLHHPHALRSRVGARNNLHASHAKFGEGDEQLARVIESMMVIRSREKIVGVGSRAGE
jgi:hypothetical protein